MFNKKSFSWRLYTIAGILILVAGMIISRLFFLQIIHREAFTREAERQYTASKTSKFSRGTISFRRKDGVLVSSATTTSGFIVALEPRRLENPSDAYKKISELLPLERDDFMAKAGKRNDPYEELANHVPKDTGDAITALKIPGVLVIREQWRFYPGGKLAAQTIGFLGYQGNELAGRYGLERQYEQVLTRNESEIFVNFFAEAFAQIKNSLGDAENEAGDLVTTIEPSVQVFLEEKLTTTKNRWSSDQVGGIIMDPHTGAIVALGSVPSFDLNAFGSVESPSVYQNPVIESVFEIGSTMKPIIMAIALEAGVVTPDTVYTDNGYIDVGNKRIYNFDKVGRGTITLQEFLNQSLNTGAVFVEQKIPRSLMYQKLKSFGFGEKTGIDLPGEVPGLTKNLESKRDVEYANIAFGQGIALTPITTIRALSVLANGGMLVHPHVGESIVHSFGTTQSIKPTEKPRSVLSQAASEEITRMLVTVFSNYSDGKYRIPHYSIAGKTGTAQIADPAGGYYKDRNLHTFFGYFPAYEPKFIIYLYNVNPKNGAEFASQTLIEPFSEIAKFLINYYDISPDG